MSKYFLKLNDLSINLLISLKWIKWGYFFLSSISKELVDIKEEYSLESLIPNSIHPEIINLAEKNHIILIDNNLIENKEDLNNLIKNFYISEIFDENTKIHLKLKLNLREYLIISNILFPVLVKFETSQLK